MEACDNHQRMGKHLVHLFDVIRERPILKPRRCDFGKSKYRNSVTTRELQNYPRDRNRDQQDIKQVVSHLPQMDGPSAKRCRSGGWRRVDQIPSHANDQQRNDSKSGGYVYK